MTPEQFDFCKMLSHPHAEFLLEDLIQAEDFAVLTDPWEKRLVLSDVPDEFIAVRWIRNYTEYYGGRHVEDVPCFPKVAQVWVGDGYYAAPNSHMECVFFDDPEYDDYWKGQIRRIA